MLGIIFAPVALLLVISFSIAISDAPAAELASRFRLTIQSSQGTMSLSCQNHVNTIVCTEQ